MELDSSTDIELKLKKSQNNTYYIWPFQKENKMAWFKPS